jgi:hypothetical protein
MSRPSNEPNAWIARRAFEKLGVGEDHDWDDAQAGQVPTEDHAAHAPGKVCELCDRVIEAGQDARLRPDGNWIHEECPIQ